MKVHYPDIDPARLEINHEDILALLGDPPGAHDSHARFLIETCESRCRTLMTPRAGFVLLNAQDNPSSERISAKEKSFTTGRIIKKMLAGSDTYAFLLATAGPGPESLARELLAKGEYLEGYISDLLASALVDAIASQVQEHIRRMALEQGLRISNRYSPGYCGWEVIEQQKLFSLFPENCCGITLSDSSLMSPIKSISALIGIGSPVRYQEYTCEICSMKECAFRKTGTTQASQN